MKQTIISFIALPSQNITEQSRRMFICSDDKSDTSFENGSLNNPIRGNGDSNDDGGFRIIFWAFLVPFVSIPGIIMGIKMCYKICSLLFKTIRFAYLFLQIRTIFNSPSKLTEITVHANKRMDFISNYFPFSWIHLSEPLAKFGLQ